MEIKPTIFCTLDNDTELIINEVFDSLPAGIRDFHRHIIWKESKDYLASEIEQAIKEIREFSGNDRHTPRYISTGYFQCDFFILLRKYDAKVISLVSETFKEKFYKNKELGNYEEIAFCLFNGAINEQKNFYQISNENSHGARLSDNELFDKVKYFFLFFLSSDIYSSGKQEYTNQAFYFSPNPSQKYFKSISMAYDGLPVFIIRELYFNFLKERFIRNLLKIEKELDTEIALNKIKGISDLEVEKLLTPAKPNIPLKLSFFSTKKGRKDEIEEALIDVKNKHGNFDKNCHAEAKKQRIVYESNTNKNLENKITNIITEIISSSQSITELRKLLAKLLDRNFGLYALISEKGKDIKWPYLFRYFKKVFKSNHPNWIINSILGGLFILPELIDYIFFFPTELMIKWNVLIGLIWSGYIVVTVFNLKNIRKTFIVYFNDLFQRIENYYSISFKSFIKFLEVYIIRIFIRKLETTDLCLIKNQAFLAALYLSSFSGNMNYESIRKNIDDTLRNNDAFAELLKAELLQQLASHNDCEDLIEKYSKLKDPVEACTKLIELTVQRGVQSKLFLLSEQIKSVNEGLGILKIIKDTVNQPFINYDNDKFLQKINLDDLDNDIDSFVQNQNFENLLSIIKQKMNISSRESKKRLMCLKNNMHYLSSSQNEIDKPHQMIFVSELTTDSEIIEYQNHLKIICGYLKIYDLKND